MEIYIQNQANLKKVEEKPFKLERDIQKLFEENLYLLTGWVLVKSEFTIKDKRLDTVAFDEQSKSFIVIEYKRDKNSSVVDQGFTYLSLMLENKAEFIVEYNEQLKSNLKRDEVDWSQTRVVFVSTFFTENQIQATNFKDIAIELWELKRYNNDIILINTIKKSKSAESIKPLTEKNPIFKKVASEIKVYTEEEHLQNLPEEIAELYENFKTAIINLSDGIKVEAKKFYIAFKKDGSNILGIQFRKKGFMIIINSKKIKLDDPRKISRNVSKIGNFCYGDYEIFVDNDDNIEYIMSLIKQVIIKTA